MDTKTISNIIVFSALTLVLNLLSLKIPAPYAPFLYYQIWEIPIVASLLLQGPTVGVIVAVINSLILFSYFPGDLPSGPFYNLAAIIGTFVGIFVIHRFVAGKIVRRKSLIISFSTLTAATLRVILMTLINWVFLRYPFPFGFGLSEPLIIAFLPYIALFNATMTFYTVPAAYILVRAISPSLKTKRWGNTN